MGHIRSWRKSLLILNGTRFERPARDFCLTPSAPEAALFKRELFAVIAGPLVLACIVFAPGWVTSVVISALIVIAGYEFFRMTRGSGLATGRIMPIFALAAMLMAAIFRGPEGLAIAVAAVVLAAPALHLAHPKAPEGALVGTSVDVFGIVYLGITGACLCWLRTMPTDDTAGIRLLIFFLVTIWIGDSGAYYVGKNLGRHHMAPILSPKKTWEGLAGGIGATFAAAAAFQALLPLPFGWSHIFGLAAILSVTAPIGDLIVSLFKRDTGVKDSSNLIPGHGGLLDRTDSLVFSAPFVLLYLMVMGLTP